MKMICFTIGVLFVTMSILFFTGKVLQWIKGWQITPDQEKENIRIMPLCRNIGFVFIGAAALFFTAGFSQSIREQWLWVGFIVWFILSALDIWYIGKSGKYLVTKPNCPQNSKRG